MFNVGTSPCCCKELHVDLSTVAHFKVGASGIDEDAKGEGSMLTHCRETCCPSELSYEPSTAVHWRLVSVMSM